MRPTTLAIKAETETSANAAAIRFKRGSVEPYHYLFPFRIGGNAQTGSYDPNRHLTTIKTSWKRLITAANLPGLRPYDMRHTGITNLLQLPEVLL